MKLAAKLTILFLLLTTIPLAVVGYLAFDNGRRTIEQNTINHLISTNILKEAEFDRWVQGNERSLRELARRPLVREYAAMLASLDPPTDPEYQAAYMSIYDDHLTPALEEDRGFLDLSILRGDDGWILISTNKSLEGKYRESEPYFVEGKSRTYVQNVYYSLTLGEAAMTIATPIRDREGNLIAVLAGHVDLAEMSEIMMQRSGLSATEETYLVNTFNFFVTEPRFGEGYALKKAVHTEGVETCLEHNDGVGFYDDYRGVPVIGAYRWMPARELCILTEVDQAEAYAPIVALRNTVLKIGVAVALMVALLGMLFARTITEPLRQLVKGTEEIGRGHLEYQIEVRARDEIGQLAGAFNDMAAKRKRAEQALQESEQWLSTTLRSIGDAVIATDARGLVTLMNPVAEELTGWDEAEAVGKPLEDVFNIINEQTGERAENPVARVLREGVVVGLANHTVLIAKHGTKRPIADSGAPMRDEQGNIIGTVMVFRDITERKQAEEALQRHVAELSALNTMAAIVNESLEVDEILNRAMDEALGQVGVEAAAMLLLDEEAGELVMVAYRGLSDEMVGAASRFKLGEGMTGRAAQTGEPAVLARLADYPGALKAYLAKDRIQSAAVVPLIGSTGLIGTMNLATASPHYFDPAGLELLTALGQQIAIGVEKARLYGETHDQAEELRKHRDHLEELVEKRSKALRESEEQFRTLAERSPNMIFINKKGRVVYANKRCEEAMGYTREEFYSPDFDFLTLIAPEYKDSIKVSFGRHMRGEEVPPYEYALLTKEGRRIEAILATRLIRYGGETAILGIATDITERKRAEEALKEYSERLEDMVEERTKELRDAQEQLVHQERLAVLGQLAGGVGHELRNPLGAIKNIAYFLNMVIESPDPEVKETLEILDKEVGTCEKIISSLLDFARPKPPVRRKVDVNDVVQEALSRTTAPENVEVETQLDEALPTILADPVQLDRVFGNLILNAIQAMTLPTPSGTPDGGRLIIRTWQEEEPKGAEGAEETEETDVPSVPSGSSVRVSISDTGVGIPEGNLDKLFEPLFTTKAKGIGLGLALVKTLVEGHGGSIEVESMVGEGSTFRVTLPVER